MLLIDAQRWNLLLLHKDGDIFFMLCCEKNCNTDYFIRDLSVKLTFLLDIEGCLIINVREILLTVFGREISSPCICIFFINGYFGRKEGNVLFNDVLNTFYLQLYGVTHMVKDHSDSERKPAPATWATLSY